MAHRNSEEKIRIVLEDPEPVPVVKPQLAADISTLQYQEGEIVYNTVISTLRNLASRQEQLAVGQGAVATNLVEVYKSLGGGWQIRQGQDSLDLIPEETRDEMLERTGAWKKVFKENG